MAYAQQQLLGDEAHAASLAASALDGGDEYGAVFTRRWVVELILDLVRFADYLPGAGLVITGEGSLDEQTLSGKAPAGVAAAAGAAGVPVVAVSGQVALAEGKLRAAGFARAYALTDIEPDLLRCLANAGPLLETLAQRIARDWLASSRHRG